MAPTLVRRLQAHSSDPKMSCESFQGKEGHQVTGYVISFTACLQEPQCNLQTTAPRTIAQGTKNLSGLPTMSARYSHRNYTPPGHFTLCLHHCEVCLGCTCHGLAVHVTGLAKLRSCLATKEVSEVLQISGPEAPGPLGM